MAKMNNKAKAKIEKKNRFLIPANFGPAKIQTCKIQQKKPKEYIHSKNLFQIIITSEVH